MALAGFGQPYIDLNEQRQAPRPYRYVHGGFEGTHTRFSLYLPPKELYRGRFVHFLQGGSGGSEHALTALALHSASWTPWLFDMAFDQLGAYVVESNQGHYPTDVVSLWDEVVSFRASSETARFAKTVAAEHYGSAPHHGYVGGPSGGGSRSLACNEHAADVYDGAVPYVAVIHVYLQYSAFANAYTLLGDKLAGVIDAAEPGGSGHIFAGLNSEQRQALAILYRTGWPRGAENQLYPPGVFAYALKGAMEDDPEYFEDFWNRPGYLGHDQPSALENRLFDRVTTVRRVITAADLPNNPMVIMRQAPPEAAIAVELDVDDPDRLLLARIEVLSGAAEGRVAWVASTQGSTLLPFGDMTPELFEGVRAGDQVRIDNRAWTAYCLYHRYGTAHVPEAREPGMPMLPEYSAFMVDGRAIYPQRPATLGPLPVVTGNFPGKMILCQGTHDPNVWPTTITPYIRMVERAHGTNWDAHFRVWWMEHASHGAPDLNPPLVTPEKRPGVWDTRLIDYSPIIRQAFLDLAAWVEEGVPAPRSTCATMTADQALVLAPTAAERGGIQPVVRATANGVARAEVRAGDAVRFEASAEAPPGTGSIVSFDWDPLGIGEWRPFTGGAAGHTYDRPGTYFAAFRSGSLRENGRGKPIHNLARVRVVVS
ncbi:MAG: PKD domain-containing protein [Chloroflexi bacterium]|nr:PKD domain-containing protein [Chloroflexota bacterium]